MVDNYDPTQDAHDSYYVAIAELRRKYLEEEKKNNERTKKILSTEEAL